MRFGAANIDSFPKGKLSDLKIAIPINLHENSKVFPKNWVNLLLTRNQKYRYIGGNTMFDRQNNARELVALLGAHAGIGLWDGILHDGDATHAKSVWTWWPEFRRMIGYTGEAAA